MTKKEKLKLAKLYNEIDSKQATVDQAELSATLK